MNDNPAHHDVSIDPSRLADIGTRLETDAVRFTDRAATVLAALSGGAQDDAATPHRPYAADPRNEPVQPVADRHEAAVASARDLLTSLATGMTTLGRAATVIGDDLIANDARQAAEVDSAGDEADEPGIRG